jgi:hypothetical protein
VGLLGKALSALRIKSGEGEYCEGPYALPVSGGWLSSTAGSFMNWWQMGYDVQTRADPRRSCRRAYLPTRRPPPCAWAATGERRSDGGRERDNQLRTVPRPAANLTTTSRPSDFILNLWSACSMRRGNAYALAVQECPVRDRRAAPDATRRSAAARVGEDGSTSSTTWAATRLMERQIGAAMRSRACRRATCCMCKPRDASPPADRGDPIDGGDARFGGVECDGPPGAGVLRPAGASVRRSAHGPRRP